MILTLCRYITKQTKSLQSKNQNITHKWQAINFSFLWETIIWFLFMLCHVRMILGLWVTDLDKICHYTKRQSLFWRFIENFSYSNRIKQQPTVLGEKLSGLKTECSLVFDLVFSCHSTKSTAPQNQICDTLLLNALQEESALFGYLWLCSVKILRCQKHWYYY